METSKINKASVVSAILLTFVITVVVTYVITANFGIDTYIQKYGQTLRASITKDVETAKKPHSLENIHPGNLSDIAGKRWKLVNTLEGEVMVISPVATEDGVLQRVDVNTNVRQFATAKVEPIEMRYTVIGNKFYAYDEDLGIYERKALFMIKDSDTLVYQGRYFHIIPESTKAKDSKEKVALR